MMKLKFIDSSRNERERDEDTVETTVTKVMIFEFKELLVDAEMLLTLNEWDDDEDEARLMMLKLLKLFVDVRECLNSLIKDEWSSFIEVSSEEDDDLSEIIDITLQTVNQWEIFHQRMFFLLIEEIVVVDKAIHVLLQSFAKI